MTSWRRRRSTWSATSPSSRSATFKLVTLDEVEAIGAELTGLLPGSTEQRRVDVIATATSLAGAFWQIATPGPEIQALYRCDPRLAHAVVDVGPRLARVLTALQGILG